MGIRYPIPLDGRCPDCNTVDLCEQVLPNPYPVFEALDIAKAAEMKLTGEHLTYTQEYAQCLERIQARERVKARREARLRSSSIKEPA